MKARLYSRLYRYFFYFILLPIRLCVKAINFAKNISPNSTTNLLRISIFRTTILNEMSTLLDSMYKVSGLETSDPGLVYVDIGAFGGLPKKISDNEQIFGTKIMCEGNQDEANKLREKGFLVIDNFLSDVQGNATFYSNRQHVGCSSIKKPGTPFLNLFSSSHLATYTDYDEVPIKTSTLDIELAKLNIDKVDFIKIDVQGSELNIIHGYKEAQPLFWEIEVLPLPTYEDTVYGTEISNELIRRGYVCFRKYSKKYKDGMMIFSNELYMPDWTKKDGIKLIKDNINNWRLLIKLFDIPIIGKEIEKELNINS